MTLSVIRGTALLAAIALVSTTNAQPPLPPPTPLPEKQEAKQDNPEQPEPGVKVAEKGVIHEAFAQPGAETRGKGLTAPKQPPAPIPEVPPETKPEGENVRWIPGYWAWNEENKDFMWVSGFWRNVPPGRTWMAGEWAEKGGQWVYSPGFWRPVDMNNWRTDLPEPPTPVESQPSTPPDNPDAVWVPGGWEYRDERYVWRAGYWAYPNDNMMWQPGQYVTSGSGYCYVPGYWDYPFEERGLLYAPVYFTEPLWTTPGWFYRPRFAFNLGFGYGWGTGSFFGSLFYGPGFNNYYYGNYFNPFYIGGWNGWWGGYWNPLWTPLFSIGFGFGGPWYGWGGYYPWWYGGHHHHHNGHHHKGYHNPTYNHYKWMNRNNPNWARQVQRPPAGRPAQGVAGAGRPLRVTPTGGAVGGALQTATRAAATTAAPRPLIQPANQVARSLQAGRQAGKLPTAGGANGAPRSGAGVVARPGGAKGVGGAVARPGGGNAPAARAPGTGRSVTGLPPTHSGALPITPRGGRAELPSVGGGRPTPKLGGVTQPQSPTIRYGNAGVPSRSPNLPITPRGDVVTRPNMGNNPPTIRYGNPLGNAPQARPNVLPGTPGLGQPNIGGGGMRPIPQQLRPGGAGTPQFRPSGGGMPMRPSGPAMRPSGGNFGGGRGPQISPSGGRPIGGGRAIGPGGGGGRPVGGGMGGGRPGGGRGGKR